MLRLLRLLFALTTRSLHSRRDLLLENLALRQQLAVLRKRYPRVRFFDSDRLFWIALLRLWSKWKRALVLVQPETVVRGVFCTATRRRGIRRVPGSQFRETFPHDSASRYLIFDRAANSMRRVSAPSGASASNRNGPAFEVHGRTVLRNASSGVAAGTCSITSSYSTNGISSGS